MYRLPEAAFQGEDSGVGQSLSKPTGDSVMRIWAIRHVRAPILRLMLEESRYPG